MKVTSVTVTLSAEDIMEDLRTLVEPKVPELSFKEVVLEDNYIQIEGSFKKGDIIKIIGISGKQLGVGKAQYNSEKATGLMRKKNEKALVHYDYLFLNDDQIK